jgi:sulfatase maturation enzyme AslB (radical SAM superfamily)
MKELKLEEDAYVHENNLLKTVKMVFLELTNYCNFRCHFCPKAISTRPPEHMDTHLAKNIIEQLHKAGYQGGLFFHLLGEPFLHPDIFEIVKFASKRSPRSFLLTNGSLLTDNNIESIFDANPFQLVISMQLIDKPSFSLRGSSFSWKRYISGIRNAVQYKLEHNPPSLLRISVGMRKENSSFPNEDYFPPISASSLRRNMNKLFSGIPSLDSYKVKKILDSVEIPWKGRLVLAPEVSLTVKSMGNWRRIYRDEKIVKGFCPHLCKEFGILSNGSLVFCYLDYDGKTTFANAKEDELQNILRNPNVQQKIGDYNKKRILPKGCQHCVIPSKAENQVGL